jgi:hypothetical protein
MTRSGDEFAHLHLSHHGTNRKDYSDHTTTGWRQLLCAWFIVLIVAALFKFSDLISTNRTAPLHKTDLAQAADVEQTGDIEHWERGVPRRQWTITVPSDRKVIMVSRLDQ